MAHDFKKFLIDLFFIIGFLPPTASYAYQNKLQQAFSNSVTLELQNEKISENTISIVSDPLSLIFAREMPHFVRTNNKVPEADAWGSGLLFSGYEKNYVITASHVLGENNRILSIKDAQGIHYKSKKIVYRDQNADFAILEVTSAEKKHAILHFGTPSLGDTVYAVGNPMGFGLSLKKGIVSALNRRISDVSSHHLIQTDMSLNPGYSGGPLIDSQGRVMGINLAIAASVSGVSFSLPLASISKQIKHLASGLATVDCEMDMEVSELRAGRDDEVYGVLVSKASENVKIKEIDLKKSDIILKLNNEKIYKKELFEQKIMNSCYNKQDLTIEFIQNGSYKKRKLTF